MLCEPRGLTIRRATVRGPNDLAQAFATLEQQGGHAVIVPNTSLLNRLGAQIASLADRHFRVEKVPGDPTHTRIEELDDLLRREEVERMAGGAEFIATLGSQSAEV